MQEGIFCMYVALKMLNSNQTSPKRNFLPRQKGNLTIAYDVLQSYGSSYLAQVTISNHNLLGRL